jgi:hypothetical protein
MIKCAGAGWNPSKQIKTKTRMKNTNVCIVYFEIGT